MYLDFHSKDSTLPDYSTRIISQGGATNGQGALNMYASTMGIMATNGVGIGTTVPSVALDVYYNGGDNGTTQANITNFAGRATMANSSALNLRIQGAGGGMVDNQISAQYNSSGTGTYSLAFKPYASTVMTVLGSGNVGIGTTVPSAALHVASGLTSDLGNGLKTKYTNIGVTAASVVSLNTVNNGVFSGSGPYTFTTNSSSLSGFFAIASGLMIGAVYQISVTCNSSNVTSITISDNLAVTYMTIPISSSSTTYTTPGYATTNASLYIIITTPTPAVGLALTFSNITVQRIDTAATGFVGIGVTLPNQTLHVKNGTGRIHVECDSNLGNAVFQCTTRNVGTSVSNTSYMFTDLNGTLQIYSDSSVTGYKNVVISNNNLFGVGTTLPYFTQSVEYYGNNATNFGINLHNTYVAGATNVRNMIVFTDVNSTQGAIGAYRVAHDSHYLGGLCFMVGSQPTGYNQGRPTTQTQARNSLTEAMRITPEGYVGIGLSNPRDTLHISATNTSVIRISNTTSGSASQLVFDPIISGYWHNNGYGNAPTTSARGQAYGAGMILVASESGNNYEDSYMAFWTCRDAHSDGAGGLGVLGERMRISSYSTVGIGTSTINSALHVYGPSGYSTSNGLLTLMNSSAGSTPWSCGPNAFGTFVVMYTTTSAGVTLGAGNTSWASTSDKRLKRNINPLPSALESVLKLRPITFNYKADENNEVPRTGFVAQEVENVFPNEASWIVTKTSEEQTDEKGDTFNVLTVSMVEMIPYMVKSIQELASQSNSHASQITQLTAENTQLKSAITAQASAISALEARLAALEAK